MVVEDLRNLRRMVVVGVGELGDLHILRRKAGVVVDHNHLHMVEVVEGRNIRRLLRHRLGKGRLGLGRPTKGRVSLSGSFYKGYGIRTETELI